jgi:hypothetical protein
MTVNSRKCDKNYRILLCSLSHQYRRKETYHYMRSSIITLFFLSIISIHFISPAFPQIHLYLVTAFPFSRFLFSTFSFFIFSCYFHYINFDALHNLTVLKRLQLVKNKMNLKNEFKLTAFSGINFFQNYKLLN